VKRWIRTILRLLPVMVVLVALLLPALPVSAADPLDLDAIIWDEWSAGKTAELVSEGDGFWSNQMPFTVVLEDNLLYDHPLRYHEGGKYISFDPADIQWITPGSSAPVKQDFSQLTTNSTGYLADKKVTYHDAFGSNIDIENSVSNSGWKKEVAIKSLVTLGVIPYNAEYLEISFELKTNFDIEGWDKKSELKFDTAIQLSTLSRIDSIGVRDSYKPTDKEIDEGYSDSLLCDGFLRTVDSKTYLVKRIPVDYLKDAVYPIYADVDISYGTKSAFTSNTASGVEVAEIGTGKFAVVWTDHDDAFKLKAIVGTVSGTTISWGDEITVCNDDHIDFTARHDVCKLDANKFLVVYADDAQGDDGYCRVATVSDKTISLGGATEFHDVDVEYPIVGQINTDKAAILYNDETSGDDLTCTVVSISGTTITPGEPYVLSTADSRYAPWDVVGVDADKYMVFYELGDVYVRAATVSGTTSTFGAASTVDTNDGSRGELGKLDTDKFALAYEDYISEQGMTRVGTLSGTTITLGAEQVFNDGITRGSIPVTLDSTHYIVFYSDYDNNRYGTTVYCSVSGNSTSCGSEEIWYSDAYMQDFDVILIATGDVIVAYMDDADANNIGEAIVGEVAALQPPDAPTNFAATENQANQVTCTWTKSDGATKYQLYRDGAPIGAELGDVATTDDATGAAATITNAGTVTASDGTESAYVTLSLAGESIGHTSYTYKVRAGSVDGWSGDSNTDTGYRVSATITYQWQVDEGGGYGNIAGGTTDPYNYAGAPAGTISNAGTVTASDGTETAHVTLSLAGEATTNGTAYAYQCVVTSTGASNSPQTSDNDTGYRGVGAITYQWQVNDGGGYDNIAGGTTDPYNYAGAPAGTITPGNAVATDGDHTDKVALNLAGESVANGTTYDYQCICSAIDASNSPQTSGNNGGYRGHGALAYQWQVDDGGGYDNIVGGTTEAYNYAGAPSPTITAGTAVATDAEHTGEVFLSLTGASSNDGATYDYKCVLDATGCAQQTSASNTGETGHGALTYQWQRSAGDSDADYSDIAGATTASYTDTDASPTGNYYQVILGAPNASNNPVTSGANRGYSLDAGVNMIQTLLRVVLAAVILVSVFLAARLGQLGWVFVILGLVGFVIIDALITAIF